MEVLERKLKDIWERFTQAGTGDELEALRDAFQSGGYPLFRDLLARLKLEVTAAEEEGLAQIKRWIANGRVLVPEPFKLSPAWEFVWDEYDTIIRFKEEAMAAITGKDREGEWQLVMDNPYTNEPISCYPALSFVEAAYLFAYFRKDIKPNEYIRLQKVVSLVIARGN